MLQFSGLAAMLREQGNRVMVYLVACILERLFGKDTIEDIEAIRDGISIPDIIDGVLTDDEVGAADAEQNVYDEEEAFLREDQPIIEEPEEPSEPQHQPQPLKPSATEWLTNSFGVKPSPSVMLGTSSSSTSVFGTSPAPAPGSVFGSSIAAAPETATPSAPASVPPEASAFANLKTRPNVFGNGSFGASSAFGASGNSSSAFGQNSSSAFGSSSSVPRASGSTDVPSTYETP